LRPLSSRLPRRRRHDPERFWDEKALRSGGEPERAACTDDPERNRCIDRVQRRLLKLGVRYLSKRSPHPGQRLLDFGCGSGRWYRFFAEHGYRYSGVDVSQEMLNIARRLHPTAIFESVEDERFPFPDETFDVAFSVAVIHHNPYDRQEQIADELSRVLRPGGHLVLFEGIGFRRQGRNIVLSRPLEDWDDLFSQRGFRLRRWYGGRYGVLRWVSEKVAARAGLNPPAEIYGEVKPLWQRLLDRTDVLFDPWLGAALPSRYQRRALMIFEKSASLCPRPAGGGESGIV
jgi:SAM-dependent methyltransferase